MPWQEGDRVPVMGPGRRVVYREDHKSFGEFILSERMRDTVEEVAHDIADLAREFSPRRKSGTPPDGTSMADQFKVKREAGTMKVDRAFRVQVDVYNEARSAAPNEFGGRRNTRHRMLGRAGAAFGDYQGPNRFVRPEGI
jgi:hypothetical protein